MQSEIPSAEPPGEAKLLQRPAEERRKQSGR